MSFVSDPAYAEQFLRHFDRLRSFILLHDMAYQPRGEVPAPAALPEGEDMAPVPVAVTA
jgi:hypothetical protein